MKKIKNKSNLIIFILFVVTLFFMSIGFAAYNKVLNLSGTAIVQPDGKIYLKSVRLTQSRSSSASPTVDSTTGMIEFNLRFTTSKNNEDDYLAVFEVVMANESSYDYVYTVPSYRPTASKNGTDYSGYVDYSIDGITSGHVIPSKTEKTFTISFTFKNPDKNSNGTLTSKEILNDYFNKIKQSSKLNISHNSMLTSKNNIDNNNSLEIRTRIKTVMVHIL